MKDQAFTTLEYDKLRALVRRGAQTPMGRLQVEALVPLDDLSELRRELRALTECVDLRERGISWSFTEMSDPAGALARLKIEGATLEPLAILELARLCEQALASRAVLLGERQSCPVLWETVENLPGQLHSLAARISNKILPSGELDDRASPELARIRSEISLLRSRITRSLENLMRRSEEAIQDELVTLRNDRFVIPVKSDHRGRVGGVAHGFSSSGATVFIEPLETIEANNELQSLRETEERETYKILSGLTDELRRELPGIEMSVSAIATLDFVNSKRVLYERLHCTVPEISEANSLELLEARHPLLEENLRAGGTEVVPVSLGLDSDHSVMVISGANAGGKTVVLKTTGLLSLMALSGLPLPARRASIPFYRSVLADIGDHQSLAANLSTFTSHVANISRMIAICKAPALVLLDEVGTGTDPDEGSALGVAVVDHFQRACGAHVLATTHYSGLKMYASNEDSVINASVEFDEKTLQPTYRLLVGIAGASSGIEIARRFGFPDEIVGAAAEYVGQSARDATSYLQRIKREADEAESLRRALEEERAAVAEKYSSLDVEARKREQERQLAFEREIETAIANFETQSRELVAKIEDRVERSKVEREAQKRSAELKREAKRATSAVSSTATAAQPNRPVRVVRAGKIISDADRAPIEEEYRVSHARPIAVGDHVRLRSFGSVGIVDKVSGDHVEVRVKALRFREKLANLDLVEAVGPRADAGLLAGMKAAAPSTKVRVRSSSDEGRVELNVIGRTTDEAVDETDKFLDEAYMNSIRHIRIVHGHGTGALRRAISELLTSHPHVERFAPAPQDQGGKGATIVELKQ